MAKRKLVEIVRMGRRAVARWRKQNPGLLLSLPDADLSGCNLAGANLQRAVLVGANLSGTNLSGANLDAADLTRASFCESLLKRATLQRANLFKASLRAADLTDADFRRAGLRGADLSEVEAAGTNFREADLTDAVLTGSRIVEVDVSRAELDGTDFSETEIGWSTFGNVDLSRIVGLKTITWLGPGTVGLDTLYRSRGRIAESFLRGCGVPPELIAAVPELTGQSEVAFAYFVRFTETEEPFARQLFEALRKHGLRCWLDGKPGDAQEDNPPATHAVSRRFDRVLLCASRNSLTSWWIDAEIDAALRREEWLREQLGREVLCLLPLNLDGFLFSGDFQHREHKRIAARVAADFVGWRRNPQKFAVETNQLVERLKADGKTTK